MRLVLPLAILLLIQAGPATASGAAQNLRSGPDPSPRSAAQFLGTGTVTLTLDILPDGTPTTPKQIFHHNQPDAMGMGDVPDMHLAAMRQPNGSYKLWIAGRFESESIEGATGLITTMDFVKYSSGYSTDSTGAVVKPVFLPSCRGATDSSACWNNLDAYYAGADLVFRGTDGDLRMLYHGATTNFGSGPPDTSASWCEVGLARSTDEGITWTGRSPIISGSDQKPDTNPSVGGVYGAVEPGAIISNGYIYAFYAYFSLPVNSRIVQPVIQVARASVSDNGAPGTWVKYYNGAFDSQPGLLGAPGTQSLGSQIVPTVSGCTRPAQPWPVFSTYLNKYVLVFIAKEGWFFTTSPDLVNWPPPVRFFPAPGDSALSNFTTGQETDENVILVTPGNPEQVIGQTGYVLYAHTASWKHQSHELWLRPFTFNYWPSGVPPGDPPLPIAYELAPNHPNPFSRSTVIGYRLPEAGMVRLDVCDVQGRKVATLVDGWNPAGSCETRFDASGLASGVYVARLQAGSFVQSRRMLVVK